MKISRMILAGVAGTVLFTQFAAAELPFNKQLLAQIDSTIDFCSQARPQSAQKFHDIATSMSKNLSAKDLEAARATDEYKDSRKTFSEDLGKLSKDDVDRTCGPAADAIDGQKKMDSKK